MTRRDLFKTFAVAAPLAAPFLTLPDGPIITKIDLASKTVTVTTTFTSKIEYARWRIEQLANRVYFGQEFRR